MDQLWDQISAHCHLLQLAAEDFSIQCADLFVDAAAALETKAVKDAAEGLAKLRRSFGPVVEAASLSSRGGGGGGGSTGQGTVTTTATASSSSSNNSCANVSRSKKATHRRDILKRQLHAALDDQSDVRGQIVSVVESAALLLDQLRKSTHLVRKNPNSQIYTDFVPPSALTRRTDLEEMTSALLTAKETLLMQRTVIQDYESKARRVPDVVKGSQTTIIRRASIGVTCGLPVDAPTSSTTTSSGSPQHHQDPNRDDGGLPFVPRLPLASIITTEAVGGGGGDTYCSSIASTTDESLPPPVAAGGDDCGAPGISSFKLTKTGSTRNVTAGRVTRQDSHASRMSGVSATPSRTGSTVKALKAGSRLLAPTASTGNKPRGGRGDTTSTSTAAGSGGGGGNKDTATTAAPTGTGTTTRSTNGLSRRQSNVSLTAGRSEGGGGGGATGTTTATTTTATTAGAVGSASSTTASPPLAQRHTADTLSPTSTSGVAPLRRVGSGGVSTSTTAGGGGGSSPVTASNSVEIETFETLFEQMETLLVLVVQRWTKAFAISVTASAEISFLNSSESLQKTNATSPPSPTPPTTRRDTRRDTNSTADVSTVKVAALEEAVATLQGKLLRSELRNTKLRKWAENEHAIATTAEQRAHDHREDLLNCLSHLRMKTC